MHGDWVWALCEAGADVELDDWDNAYIFCNLRRGRRFAPLRPESVYKHLGVRKRDVPGLPPHMTPHWYRHTHATALLLSGVPMHVVSRRLGHADIQTTIARRQTQFAARHGEPMGEDNVWLAGRLAETRALSKVLVALDQVSVHEDGQLRAVRGAGAADRPEPPFTAQHQEPTA
jgi:hypothetical protein